MMKMRMLLVGLCIAALAAPVAAATGTVDIYGDFNLVAAPNVPFNPDPAAIFAGAALDSNLTRLDPTTGSDVLYSEFDPSEFGNLLLGEGYWLFADGPATYTYDGIESGVPAVAGGAGTDMWISLPGNQYDANSTDRNGDGVADGGGWHIVGNPYAAPVSKENFFFTDGVEVKSWQEAFDAKWVGGEFQGYEGAYQSSWIISLEFGDAEEFSPARAYYIETYKDNLAMIIKAP